jgi:hypothetical protein
MNTEKSLAIVQFPAADQTGNDPGAIVPRSVVMSRLFLLPRAIPNDPPSRDLNVTDDHPVRMSHFPTAQLHGLNAERCPGKASEAPPAEAQSPCTSFPRCVTVLSEEKRAQSVAYCSAHFFSAAAASCPTKNARSVPYRMRS